jgi:SAM-dependent methyltransferase
LVVIDPRAGARSAAAPASAVPTAEVVWHDLECGGYRADLALWRELAQAAGGPVLDVGAGAGRVALDLARAGHVVTAVDIEGVLLGALRERAAELHVETVCADARAFELPRRDFAACLVPMQTIQLLGGGAGRTAFLSRARDHLRPGATIACALLGKLEPFDCSAGTIGPVAERARMGGLLYLSRATRVSELGEKVVVERERRVIADAAPSPGDSFDGPDGARGEREVNVIELDRVEAGQLEREANDVGLRPLARREIAATEEHVGSIVVTLGV